ncbi:ABC transporter ATP-binding protein [Actinoallomurus rhizosphaericola]|uniref:ABC transporter ATP-binding protein n=1 Tax=Actinoallomurus rhizosphaericola TaxID=2952536 RepID=UPI002092CB6B|nr:ABC transporter ATP-binding protein [Actinoallomurus rhizosphaericola]MCO5998440.1 ABC transporter ATP-binding protein/permease [Actinoallomurus rhizosphaericola]
MRRIASYARSYSFDLLLLLALNVIAAVTTVTSPLLLKSIVDRGIVPQRGRVIIWLAALTTAVAVADALIGLAQQWYSGRLGEGLVYDLRTKAFDHILHMPVGFFAHAQTGALVSRLNDDVVGAQRALTTVLSSVGANIISLALLLTTMFALSPSVALAAGALLPIFIFVSKCMSRRLQNVNRKQMELDAEIGSLMTERFNVAGAMLAKLYGRPEDESSAFAQRAQQIRDIGVIPAVYTGVLFGSVTVVATLSVAAVYGFGGVLVVNGKFQLGSLIALTVLLARTYGPLTALSNAHVAVITALTSFDRIFEVLDLKPLIDEKPDPLPLSVTSETADIEFDEVVFRYPAAEDISLASLGSVSAIEVSPSRKVLDGVSFKVPPGTMTALVGSSGAGKTTITYLVSRLYDVTDGYVRIGGCDVRDLSLESLHGAIGVVTQDAHLFHDTLRANLIYARPGATDQELLVAMQAAQIGHLVDRMPDGLDTVVGDRGYRLSGGEKQRLAIARMLLKAPSVAILDEATAQLDSESEAAVQRALHTALAGRTSLVIAHRLSTIRAAHQILVIDDGRIVEHGQHEELISAGGLYSELYHRQFGE